MTTHRCPCGSTSEPLHECDECSVVVCDDCVYFTDTGALCDFHAPSKGGMPEPAPLYVLL